MRTVCLTQSGTSGRAISPSGRPRLSTSSGSKRLEVGEQQQVGLVAGRDRAEVREPVPGRRVERRASRARPRARCRPRPRAHHRVDVALVGDVLRLAVVGAERHPAAGRTPARAAAARGGCAPPRPRGSAATSRRAAARGPPRASPPRGRSGSRRRRRRSASLPSTPGAWPSTCSAPRSRELRQLVLVAGDHAGEVHHLGEPDHAPPAQQRPRGRPAVSGRRGDSNVEAGTHDEAMK